MTAVGIILISYLSGFPIQIGPVFYKMEDCEKAWTKVVSNYDNKPRPHQNQKDSHLCIEINYKQEKVICEGEKKNVSFHQSQK